MNPQPSTTDPETYQRWDHAWKRALDTRCNEILKEMCHIDLGSTLLVRGPDQAAITFPTDRIYLARHDNGTVDIIHFVMQLDERPRFESELFASWVYLDNEYPDEDRYKLHQVVILPTGAGNYTGVRRRNGLTQGYHVINVPAIPVHELLDGPLPSLALWSAEKPLEVIDPVVDRIAQIPGLEARTVVADLALLHDKEVAIRFADALRDRVPEHGENLSAS